MKLAVARGALIIAAFMFFFAGCAHKEQVAVEEPVIQEVKAEPFAAAPAPAEEPAPTPEPAVAAAAEPTPQPERKEEKPAPEPQVAIEPATEEPAPIYFAFDSYLLEESAKEILTRNAEILRKNPARQVVIEGHCDERGSDDYNLALGDRRAQAAKNYLLSLGVERERVSTVSYGEEHPKNPGHDEGCWSQNRRDEFVVQ